MKPIEELLSQAKEAIQADRSEEVASHLPRHLSGAGPAAGTAPQGGGALRALPGEVRGKRLVHRDLL